MAGSASLVKALAAQKQRLQASQQAVTQTTEQPTSKTQPINNQSDKKSNKPAVNQSNKQPTKQTNNQSNKQSNKQSNNQSTVQPQSNKQSNNPSSAKPFKLKRSRFDSSDEQPNKRAKPSDESITESVSESVTEPIAEPTPPSRFQSINDAFAQSTSQPITQIVKQPKNQSNKVTKNNQKANPPSLLSNLTSRLASGHFRYLNEQLYTMTSSNAYDYFQSNPAEFDAYHAGFREQVSKWPVNPLNMIIEYIQEKYIDQSAPHHSQSSDPSNHQWNKQAKQSTKGPLVIADMGCGDAVLSETLDQNNQSKKQAKKQSADDSNKKVITHSFDLISTNPRITACNISATPLENDSVDIVVFCLSLMGTDYEAFLREAHRILKVKGELIIAEVTSRLTKHSNAVFVESVRHKGFRSMHQSINQYFSLFHFAKTHPHEKRTDKSTKKSLPVVDGPVLTPCIYKKR